MLIAPLCDNEASIASPVGLFAVCGWFTCVLYVVEVVVDVCLLARCRCFLLDPCSGSFLSRVDIFDFAGILRRERRCCLQLMLLCVIRCRSSLAGCLSVLCPPELEIFESRLEDQKFYLTSNLCRGGFEMRNVWR